MLSFYSENRKRIFLHFFIFSVFAFYILSTAVNILLFHFVIDVNLAKVGMFLAVTGLGVLVWQDFGLLWGRLRLPIIIIACWSAYLCINSYFGATPIISLKLCLRVFGAWVIAFEIGLLLQQSGTRNRYPIVVALIFSLLMISLIWYLVSIRSPSVVWFQENIPNYQANYGRFNGLYLNPNELGYALVMHAMVLIWYSFQPLGSLFFIPFASVVSFIGILKSQSRNSLIGISVVVVMALVAYLGMIHPRIGKKKSVLLFIAFFFCVILTLKYVPNILPVRVSNSITRFSKDIGKVSLSDVSGKNFGTLLQSLPNSRARRKIWSSAFNSWVARPWQGIGLGSFQYIYKPGKSFTTHNFIFGVLVEQGIIGLSFLLLLTGSLVILMKNWEATCLIVAFPLTLLFDDLSPSYVFPMYTSLVLGFCFYTVLNRKCLTTTELNNT